MAKKKSNTIHGKAAGEKHSKSFSGVHASRRNFLKSIWGWLGVILSFEFVWMAFSFLSPAKNSSGKKKNFITVGALKNIRKNEVVPVRSGKFYLVRQADGELLALSLKCTHLGCMVVWDPAKKHFVCPCHSSEFAMNGTVLNPPAPRSLDRYPVIVEDGIVKVNIAKPVKRS